MSNLTGNYSWTLESRSMNRSSLEGITPKQRYGFLIGFGILAVLGFMVNLAVIVHVILRRLYRNFVSSHFIAHLSLLNALTCACLIPLFLKNINNWESTVFREKNMVCRLHGFITCTIWAVSYYMTTCISGVHLLTFARIHYDQLFGLHPSIICLLSWLIGVALGLPCLTNGSIVKYDPAYHYCLWADNSSGMKFLAYLLLLGIFLPVALTTYAYIRVLAIFYHAPIVFETLGLFKSRYLIFALLLTPLLQAPFFISRFAASPAADPRAPVFFMFLAFMPAVSHGFLYGLSIFLMKEDDMALTARSHKANTYQAANEKAQEL